MNKKLSLTDMLNLPIDFSANKLFEMDRAAFAKYMGFTTMTCEEALHLTQLFNALIKNDTKSYLELMDLYFVKKIDGGVNISNSRPPQYKAPKEEETYTEAGN